MKSGLFTLWLLLSANVVFAEEVAPAEPAQAQDEEAPSRSLTDVFKLSGFGTLGIVGSDNDRADFVTSVAQSNGAGYTRDWSASVDSRVGVQLSFIPTDKFSAVLQLISEQDYKSSWEPDVEWAYLQYNFTPDFSLRAGRMVLPTFMFSEQRKVGFSLPWVRPPAEFYNVPNTTTDGLGAIYRHHFGELNYTLYATYGQDDSKFQGGTHSKSRESFTLSNTFDYGNTSFRLAYSRVKITLDEVDDLLSIYRAFGPQGEAIYDKFSAHDREFRQIGAGIWHDTGKWFAGGEWSRAYTDTMI
ncbi:MAG TPA: hypothetical protein VFS17_09410, partial [Methylophilaceae bacterium]|nr:hypothetical protein [Methylophilaceae bacterium]